MSDNIEELESQEDYIELDEETYQLAVALSESRGISVDELVKEILLEALENGELD